MECSANLRFAAFRLFATRSDKPGCLATVEAELELESLYRKDAAGVGYSSLPRRGVNRTSSGPVAASLARAPVPFELAHLLVSEAITEKNNSNLPPDTSTTNPPEFRAAPSAVGRLHFLKNRVDIGARRRTPRGMEFSALAAHLVCGATFSWTYLSKSRSLALSSRPIGPIDSGRSHSRPRIIPGGGFERHSDWTTAD
jgi:hypothetical protein